MMRSSRSEPLADRMRLLGLVGLTVATGVGLHFVAGPPHPPTALPTPDQLGAVLAGASVPLAAFGYAAASVAWLLWLWLAGSIGLELVVALAESAASGTAWVRTLRQLANRLSMPLARRAVSAAFAVQVLTRAVPVAAAAPPPIEQALLRPTDVVAAPEARQAATVQPVGTYLVRPGDTLWTIAEAAYGSGSDYRRLVDANIGRRMPDGSTFPRHGVIQPGWLLDVPEPTTWLDSRDGERIYTVRTGDTLSGIAGDLLGDSARWHELFELNRGASALDEGRTFAEPDLIWPGLRLRLPGTTAATIVVEPDEPESEPAPLGIANQPPGAPLPSAAAAIEAPVDDTAEMTLLAMTTPHVDPPPPLVRQLHPVPPLALEEVESVDPPPVDEMPVSTEPAPSSASEPPLAAAGAAGLAAIGAVGIGLHRLRRLRRLPRQAESDVAVHGGYAEAQLTQEFARHLQGVEHDAATLLAGQFQAFLDEYDLDDVHIVAARYGRSSTTLSVATGLAQQAILVDLAPVYATRLESDVEAWVSTDQDVQLRFDQPRKLRLLQPADAERPRLPTLIPLGLLMDRQVLSAAWSSMGNTVVASMPGQGAETIMTSLLATLAARRSPADLRLWLIAPPRTFAAPIEQLPHVECSIDPSSEDGRNKALADLRRLLDAREQTATSAPEVVVVLAELTSLGERAADVQLLAARAAASGVRLLAATNQPEAAAHSPLLSQFVTRMVLRLEAEETSVALLGVADAAWLGGGGRLMLRLDGREPVELYGYQIVMEHLERLVRVMRVSYVSAPQPAPTVTNIAEPAPVAVAEPADTAAAGPANTAHVRDCEKDLDDGPPIYVHCFGAPKVLCGGVQVWPRQDYAEAKPWEFLLYLACQPTEGVARDDVVQALWPDEDAATDSTGRFRTLRYRIRQAFNAMADGPASDGVCLDRKGILSLDQTIVRSDAQEFLELVRQARVFPGPQAIPHLEQARALYTAHLLDAPDTRRYAWVDERDESGVTLREHFRRVLKQATTLLADLYLGGNSIDEAIETYRELGEADPDEDRVWITLFQLHASRFDRPALLREERRMRAALRELEASEGAASGSCQPSREVVAEFKRLLAVIDDHDSASAAAV